MATDQAASEIADAYNEWAELYDTNTNHTRDLNAALIRQQDLAIAGKRVLELGCGTGLNTVWLAQQAQAVVGLDFSEGMLAKARERVQAGNVRLLQADVTQPWPVDPGFDLIVVNLVLEHVKQLTPVFEQAFRMLVPGGYFYVSELHPLRQATGSQAKYVPPDAGVEVLVAAYEHPFSEYLNTALETGFTIVRCDEWRARPDEPYRLLTWLFRRR